MKVYELINKINEIIKEKEISRITTIIAYMNYIINDNISNKNYLTERCSWDMLNGADNYIYIDNIRLDVVFKSKTLYNEGEENEEYKIVDYIVLSEKDKCFKNTSINFIMNSYLSRVYNIYSNNFKEFKTLRKHITKKLDFSDFLLFGC